MRISDWSSDVCSSDLASLAQLVATRDQSRLLAEATYPAGSPAGNACEPEESMHRKVVPDIVHQQKIELLPASPTIRDAATNITARHIAAVLIGKGSLQPGILHDPDLPLRVIDPGHDPHTPHKKTVMKPA